MHDRKLVTFVASGIALVLGGVGVALNMPLAGGAVILIGAIGFLAALDLK